MFKKFTNVAVPTLVLFSLWAMNSEVYASSSGDNDKSSNKDDSHKNKDDESLDNNCSNNKGLSNSVDFCDENFEERSPPPSSPPSSPTFDDNNDEHSPPPPPSSPSHGIKDTETFYNKSGKEDDKDDGSLSTYYTVGTDYMFGEKIKAIEKELEHQANMIAEIYSMFKKEKDIRTGGETVDGPQRTTSGHFFAGVFDAILLTDIVEPAAIDPVSNSSGAGTVGFALRPVYGNLKLDKSTEDSVTGALADIGYLSDSAAFALGIYGKFYRHSIVENRDRANVNSFAAGIYALFSGSMFDLKLSTAFARNNFSLSREDGKYKSNFPGYTLTVDLESALKFKLNSFLTLRPFLGARMSLLSHGDFSEGDSSELKVSSGKYNLTLATVGVALVGATGPLVVHIALEEKFRIPSGPLVLKTTEGGSKYEDKTLENLNNLLGVKIGLDYRLVKNVSLGLNAGYYGDSKNSMNFWNTAGTIVFKF
jgi:hypothetical protein